MALGELLGLGWEELGQGRGGWGLQGQVTTSPSKERSSPWDPALGSPCSPQLIGNQQRLEETPTPTCM